MADIPTMLSNLRHPRRNRSISLGPQSEADAYETMAYREFRRRESRSEKKPSIPAVQQNGKEAQSYFSLSTSRANAARPTAGMTLTPRPSNEALRKALLDAETAVYTPLTPAVDGVNASRDPSQERRQLELEDSEMFSKLTKPRVRYDVEVVTKLIVYTGKEDSLLNFVKLMLGHRHRMYSSRLGANTISAAWSEY